MIEDGHSYCYIAKEFHLSKTTIVEIVKHSRIGDNNKSWILKSKSYIEQASWA